MSSIRRESIHPQRPRRCYSSYRRLKLMTSASSSYLLLVLYAAVIVINLVTGAPVRHKSAYTKMEHYLLKFGYLPHSETEIRDRVSEVAVSDAIRRLQRFAHLKETGVADPQTLQLMSKPRCGNPDELNGQFRSRSKRFAVQGQKWEKTTITWGLVKSSHSPNLGSDAIQEELDAAFRVWSTNTTLKFERLDPRNSQKADIRIIFDKGEHGDGFKFDGKGTVLAHAFFPGRDQGGDAHFDDDEHWVLSYQPEEERSRATVLFSVAAHEFGHSLGLSHSDVPGALMYPWYQTFNRSSPLPYDDVYGIQQIYGYNRETAYNPYPPVRLTPAPETPTRAPTNKGVAPSGPNKPRRPKDDRPNPCDTTYDAISLIRGELFIFKGRYYWRLEDKGSASNPSPALITHMWSALPKNLTHVDAVYERKGQDITFFIGKKYWIFRGNSLIRGNEPLTNLRIREDVEKIDGAFVWGHNDKTYLFSGSEYWRLDDTSDKGHYFVEPDYPRNIYVWKGVPDNIDSVFRWRDKKSYFFKGKVFWEFDDRHMEVASETPSLSAPYWMGCTYVEGITPHRRVSNNPSDKIPSLAYSPSVSVSLILLIVISYLL